MPIPYKEIKKIIRFKERDNNEVRFSDYDIKLAVNEVIRYLSLNQALDNSDFLEAEKVYDEDKINRFRIDEGLEPIDVTLDGVPLPENFMSLVAVVGKQGMLMEACPSHETPRFWQYNVRANKLYCGQHFFRLQYKKRLEEIRDEEDMVALPDVFKDTLVNLARMVLNQAENDILKDAINDAVAMLVPKRRYRNAKIRMPFVIR